MIIHVDMDAFYASVEEREQPGLRGRPVIVGGAAESRGVVAAANYAARKFGIHSAMPTSQAVRLCPDLVLLRPRMSLYSEVSQQIHKIFLRYTPEIEPLSLDEAFLGVDASERLFGSAHDIGLGIKEDIKNELSLVASVGIAPTKFVAKIASDIDKPDGFREVAKSDVQAFLDPLPVGRLWGVGKATNAEFERLGIKTIKQLRHQPLDAIEYRFGKSGKHLWELAHGIDPRVVVTDQKARSISNETTFASDIRESAVLRSILMDLTEQVSFRLRRHNYYCTTVQIKLRHADFKTITRSQSLPNNTQNTQDIWKTAVGLLDKALAGKSTPIRLLGVGVSGLTKQAQGILQEDLFSTTTTEKEQKLDHIADDIKNRFGTGSIKRASGYKKKD
ncbi:MAG: DNA polymerase IV [Gammaproteobacteria bacterium]|nr:DNA polymerase IV [Gammaproteobacteria bacterium]